MINAFIIGKTKDMIVALLWWLFVCKPNCEGEAEDEELEASLDYHCREKLLNREIRIKHCFITSLSKKYCFPFIQILSLII